MKTVKNLLATLISVSIVLLSVSCGSSGPAGPRDAVIELFGAMEKNDQAALAHLLDLTALMNNSDLRLRMICQQRRAVLYTCSFLRSVHF